MITVTVQCAPTYCTYCVSTCNSWFFWAWTCQLCSIQWWDKCRKIRISIFLASKIAHVNGGEILFMLRKVSRRDVQSDFLCWDDEQQQRDQSGIISNSSLNPSMMKGALYSILKILERICSLYDSSHLVWCSVYGQAFLKKCSYNLHINI